MHKRDIIIEENIFELKNYSNIYFYDDIEKIDNKLLEKDSLVVYVSNEEDAEAVYSVLSDRGRFSDYERLYVAAYSSAYKYSK